jgi:hypothetical protein
MYMQEMIHYITSVLTENACGCYNFLNFFMLPSLLYYLLYYLLY